MAQMSNIKYNMSLLHLDFFYILLQIFFKLYIIFGRCCHGIHILKCNRQNSKIKHSNLPILYMCRRYIDQECTTPVLSFLLSLYIIYHSNFLYNNSFFQLIFLRILQEVLLYNQIFYKYYLPFQISNNLQFIIDIDYSENL